MPASDRTPTPSPRTSSASPVELGWEAICLHRAIDRLRDALDELEVAADRLLERAIHTHRHDVELDGGLR